MKNILTPAIPAPQTALAGAPIDAGGLSRYLRQIAAVPMLSAAEESELAARLRRDNDIEAARRLALSHLRLVASLSLNYSGYGLARGDLIQEGNVGLMKAVKRFDPDKGARLATFASYWIRAEMHEFILRNWRLVKIATTKAQRKLFFKLRSFLADKRAHEIDEGEVAARLGVKKSDVREMRGRFAGGDVPLEARHAREDGEATAPIDSLATPDPTPEERLFARFDRGQTKRALAAAIDALDPRSREIVRARRLREPPATLHQLAAHWGVSAERVRQIEARALTDMAKTARRALAA